MVNRIKCFFVEPTNRGSIHLRRYAFEGKTFHNATVRVEDGDLPIVGTGKNRKIGIATWPADDPRWPTHAEDGYEFTPEDPRQVVCEEYYRDPKSGSQWLKDDLPNGAMYDAYWMPAQWTGTDGISATVVVPDGKHWRIDGPCSSGQEWTREGVLPAITVRPSILIDNGYHGWLTDGWLEPC